MTVGFSLSVLLSLPQSRADVHEAVNTHSHRRKEVGSSAPEERTSDHARLLWEAHLLKAVSLLAVSSRSSGKLHVTHTLHMHT